jgi:hypothetical protein
MLTAKISQLAGFGNRLSGLNLFTTDAESFLGPAAGLFFPPAGSGEVLPV